MSFNNRVMIQMALAAKRREYIENWRSTTELGMGAATINWWAECIERVNDAALAIAKLEAL